MNANVIPLGSQSNQPVGARAVDVHRGKVSGVVSSQWFSRPDDQRFLSLDELYNATKAMADASWSDPVHTGKIRVDIDEGAPKDMKLILPDAREVRPTNWSFGQVCSLIGAPSGYLNKLPAIVAGVPLAYGLHNYRGEMMKVYAGDFDGTDEPATLRAMTGVNYGRIPDHEVVDAVRQIVNEDGGNWKVPGVIDWGNGTYDPNVPATRNSTTLYASDRDVFIFMVDDTHPIAVGTLQNGDPDYLFPGFVVYNSEVGAKALNIETMYLRAVCQNRNLWGVENHQKFNIRHTSLAPERFATDALPHLRSFANISANAVRNKAIEAQRTIVAEEPENAMSFLANLKFSKSASKGIIDGFVETEGRRPKSIWDMTQAITAAARSVPHQDERLTMEATAGKLMAKV